MAAIIGDAHGGRNALTTRTHGERVRVPPVYEALSQQRVEVAPVHFDGVGYLRIAAPYNTPDDYDRLADTVRKLLDRRVRVTTRS
jgi:hypothetical protein